MLLLNFAHPLLPEQLAGVETLIGRAVDRVVEIPTYFDPALPFCPQIVALADAAGRAAGLSAAEWQTHPLLINLPALSIIAGLLIAELHGRCGYFPAVLRLRPAEGVVPAHFETAEVLNLQAVREAARTHR